MAYVRVITIGTFVGLVCRMLKENVLVQIVFVDACHVTHGTLLPIYYIEYYKLVIHTTVILIKITFGHVLCFLTCSLSKLFVENFLLQCEH